MRISLLARFCCAGFLVGAALAGVVDAIPHVLIGVISALAAGIACLFGRSGESIFILCLLLGFLYTGERHRLFVQHQATYEGLTAFRGLVLYRDAFPNKQRLTVAVQEPDYYSGSRLFMYFKRYPRIGEGMNIAFSCEPRRITKVDDFDFDLYAETLGVSDMCFPSSIDVVGEHKSVRTAAFRVKEWYSDTITRAFHEPVSSFLKAIVLRETRDVPASVSSAFSAAGTAHIISISGLHISFLIFVIDELLIVSYARPRTRFFIISAVTGLYVIVLNAPASAVRAWIMGMALLASRAWGRPYNGMHVLLLCAAGMVVAQPLIVAYDAGFQLSFAALAGIVLTYDAWLIALRAVPERFAIRSMLALSFSAQLFTWPLVAYHFGIVSLISPIANMIAVPLSALVITGGLLLPFVLPVPVAGDFIRWPLYTFASVVMESASVFSRVYFSHIVIPRFSILAVVAGCAASVLVVLLLRRVRQRQERKIISYE